MGIRYLKLTKDDMAFIEKQHVFFLASSSGKEVNLSPKGYDSIRVLNETTLLYLDYAGSGNRTARDIQNNGEITILFNSFLEVEAKILRLFAKGEIVNQSDKKALEYASKFKIDIDLIRQFFIFKIYAVETSCGEAVPIMKFEKVRTGLGDWIKNMSKKGELSEYIKKHEVPPSLDNLEKV